MSTFEVTFSGGPLGVRAVTAGNIEKHWADFTPMLDRGVILNSVTATVTAGASTVSGAALSMDHKRAYWFIHATDDAEQCTVEITIVTNDGQTLLYTVLYVVE